MTRSFQMIVKFVFTGIWIPENKETIIVGDFNINLKKEGSKQSNLLKFMEQCGLHQHITNSTHQSENEEASLIDHVYASSQISPRIKIEKKCVQFSDHDVLFVKIKKWIHCYIEIYIQSY